MLAKKPVEPIVKWVGGKRQLLDTFMPLLPKKITTYDYCEPFVGDGAMLFDLHQKTAYVNDINKELISLYEVVREDVGTLISILQEFKNESDYFYVIRDWDRDKENIII